MISGEKKQKKILTEFLVIFSAAFISILLTQDFLFTIEPLKQLELKLIDKRFAERGKIDIEKKSDVIIIEITQESYDQIPQPYNKWPWPRSIFSKVIDNLTAAGVKAIGIDINMAGPDQFSPRNDSLMRAAILKSGRVVVAGKIDTQLENLIEENKTNVTKVSENFDNIFYDVDSSLGLVQPPPDYDGVFRRYIPYAISNTANKKIPSFGFAILSKYYGLPNTFTATRDNGYFNLGKKLIPQYDAQSVLINFYGPSGTFPRVQLLDILDDKEFKTADELDLGEDINTWDSKEYGLLHSGRFKNKIVIIGSTMPEDRDLFPISFAKGKQKGDNLIYGVEFHANIIQNILGNDFLYKQSEASVLATIFLLTAFSFFLTSFIRKIKLKIGLLIEVFNVLLIAGSVFLFYEISVYLFKENHIVIALVGPFMALILGYFSSTAYHFITERQQNVLIKGMFSHYVSKNVVNELISNPEKLKLGGEKKNITILFSDIAGFTTFAEKKQPEELVAFINEFLSSMSEIIIANDGTLDKYLGDAVMAFWGAPIEVENHAAKACLTALQMQARLAQLRERWMASGESPIYIRIGINTGDVIVGNIGGEKRFDYTVLGDDVNLASRLEGANKEYATNIMIGESTYQMIKDKFLVRELDVIRVKGKSEPTKVYELISEIGDKKAEEAVEQMDLYLQGLDLFRLKSFEAAHDYFRRSYEKLNDYPSKVYMHRCEFYLVNPPREDWDGVFEFKTK
jgi:adenylate cyclase